MTKPQTDVGSCPHCKPDKYPLTGTPIYGCPCKCHQTPPPQKQDYFPDVINPKIIQPPQTEQKIKDAIRTVIGVKVSSHGRPDLNIPARSYYAADEKQVSELYSILTASNREARIDELEKEIARLEAPNGPFNAKTWIISELKARLAELKAQLGE